MGRTKECVASFFCEEEEDDSSGDYYVAGLRDKDTGLIYKDESRSALRGKVIFLILPFTPVLVAGLIVYNILRIIPVIIYVTGKFFYDCYKGNPLYLDPSNGPEKSKMKHAKDKAKLLSQELLRSIRNIGSAIFYGIALMFSAIYMIFDPFNGRKMYASYELLLNHRIPLKESWWSIAGPQKHFSLHIIGDNGFIMAGCLQAQAQTDMEPVEELIKIKDQSFKQYRVRTYKKINSQANVISYYPQEKRTTIKISEAPSCIGLPTFSSILLNDPLQKCLGFSRKIEAY